MCNFSKFLLHYWEFFFKNILDGASVDTAASQRGVNPSIGEVSLGMSASLSLGSGSHLDRITLNRDRESDRESASNVALAGSIASASLMAGAGK